MSDFLPFYVFFYINACNTSLREVFLRGMYIATYDNWRPGQIWSVPEMEGVVLLVDTCHLVNGPHGNPSFSIMAESGPHRQILSNIGDIADRLTEHN